MTILVDVLRCFFYAQLFIMPVMSLYIASYYFRRPVIITIMTIMYFTTNYVFPTCDVGNYVFGNFVCHYICMILYWCVVSRIFVRNVKNYHINKIDGWKIVSHIICLFFAPRWTATSSSCSSCSSCSSPPRRTTTTLTTGVMTCWRGNLLTM